MANSESKMQTMLCLVFSPWNFDSITIVNTWVILILSEARCSGCCTLQMTNSLLNIDSSLQCFQCICMYVWLDALYLSTRNYQLSLIATFPSRPNWAMNIGIARKMLLNFALISPFIHFRTSPPRITNIRLLMHVQCAFQHNLTKLHANLSFNAHWSHTIRTWCKMMVERINMIVRRKTREHKRLF